MRAAAEILAGVLSRVFSTPVPVSPSEWAARYRFVVTPEGVVPWSPNTPYLDEVVDTIFDPGIQQVTIIKGSQTGGTEALYNALFYMVDRKPGLTMLVYPDADSAREQNKFRFMPNVRATPAVADRLGPSPRDAQSMHVQFDRMGLIWRGAASEHKIESFPCPVVVVDELDRCPVNTAHLARQRIKTFPDGKLIVNGKPGLSDQGADAEYKASDQRRYQVPCPHCHKYHVRLFSRIRWWGKQRDGTMGPDSRDILTDPMKGQETAWYKCPACKGRIAPEANQWQLRLGRWAARGQTVTDVRVVDGVEQRGELVGDRPDTDHAGFHIPGFLTGLRTNPYAEVVRDFLRRKGIIDADFVADHLGEAWHPRGDRLDADKLAALALRSPYQLGQVPDGVLVLVAAADIQTDAAYVVVRGFGEHGRDRWLIWRERVPCPEQVGLHPLDHLLYGVRFLRSDGSEMGIGVRFIDSGDRTKEVYDYCRTRARCYPTKGMQTMETPHRISRLDKWPDGKPMVGGLKLLLINTHMWKQDVMRRLRAMLPETERAEEAPGLGEWTLETGGQFGRWYFPADTGADYFAQVTSEECRRTVSGATVKYQWVVRPGRQNHYFDAEVMAEAGADALGVRAMRIAAAPTTDNDGESIRPSQPRREVSSLVARARERAAQRR